MILIQKIEWNVSQQYVIYAQRCCLMEHARTSLVCHDEWESWVQEEKRLTSDEEEEEEEEYVEEEE